MDFRTDNAPRRTAADAIDALPAAPVFPPAAADEADDSTAGIPQHRVTAQWILAAALTMGLIGERLDVRWFDGHAGLAMWLTAAVGMTFLTLRRFRTTVSRLARTLLVLAVGFALLLAWRTSELLQLGNTLVVLTTIALALAVELHTPAQTLYRVRDVLSAVVVTAREAVVGTMRFVFLDAVAALSISSVRFYVTGLVARGLILGAVVTSAFAVLLSAGDPVFAKWISIPLGWDPEPLIERCLIAGVWTWPALGVLRMTTLGVPAIPVLGRPAASAPRLQLNRLDVLTVLSSLVALFAVFVLAQLRVLFGGTAYVNAVTGLTIAEYARSGFFTLVAASGLSVVALLVLDAMLRDATLSQWPTARRLSYALLAGVGVVLVSAASRMSLYVQSFGASVERYYTFAIMLWVAFVLLWCGRTVLRGKPRYFAMGSLAAGWCSLLLCNVVNIEALVVRANIARWQQGKSFDFAYNGNLGVDAVPALIQGVSAMPVAAFPTPATKDNGCAMITRLRAWNQSSTDNVGIGKFNVAIWRARRAAAAHDAELAARACAPTPVPTAATPVASPPRATVP